MAFSGRPRFFFFARPFVCAIPSTTKTGPPACACVIVRFTYEVSFVHLPGRGGLTCTLAFALACSPCSLGRDSWCGRSWIIVDGVCARPYPPPAIAMCLRWGGVGLVVSRESRVPALCGGYAHARRCVVPWWPLGHQGSLRNATNPHCIALGPPPVSPSLHRASFQKSARGGRTPNRFYLLSHARAPSPMRARASGAA